MGRRPYIEQGHIGDEFRARGYGSKPNGYTTHCTQYEVVGMDGRHDWFRWHCRECDSKYISRRHEKSQKYYQCTECDAWHFVYSGFFAQPSRKNGCETIPLTQDEYSEELCVAELKYGTLDPDKYYGTREWLQERVDKEKYELVSDIKVVE